MTNERIAHIQALVEPIRNQIIHHKAYSKIKTIEDLKIFMSFHVYAVWDFMSLLKSLQQDLTCTTVPWFPTGNSDTRFLINEIVVGEESDVDLYGQRKSHFELYTEAMQQCGADTEPITTFLETLKATADFNTAFDTANTPDEARSFVDFTFQIINSRKTHLKAAIFTFGREDLIPGMFVSMVEDIYQRIPDSVSVFKYYLERHIEVDGDHHSHLAIEMLNHLCGDDDSRWAEAESAILASLEQRKRLWDGVYEAILATRSIAV